MTLLASNHIRPVLLNEQGVPTRWSLLGASVPQPIFEQFRLYRAAERCGATVCLSPYNTSPVIRRTSLLQITVIHDLIYLEDEGPTTARSIRQELGRSYRRWVVPRAATRASVVVTVSTMMKDRLVERFGVNPDDVFVVPNAADDELYVPYTHTLEARPRLLAVAGSAPHKNLARLLGCAADLIRSGVAVDVDVVGVAVDEGRRLLRAQGAEAEAHAFTFLKGISRAQLHAVYRRASCFVMPSLAEGFGIPLLEALAAGIPCLASDIPIFREIAGPDCTYFDPCSSQDLLEALRGALRRVKTLRGPALERSPASSALRFSASAVAVVVDEMWAQVKARAQGRIA